VRQKNSPYTDAIEIAANDHQADIISCSWGFENEGYFRSLDLALQYLISRQGKIVLFAAGNGQRVWPGSMPEIISIGGVYADEHGEFEASSVASGYRSQMNQSRQVPDVCGLCGQAPQGVYIPMPCPPGSDMDVQYGGAQFPDGDGIAPDDGWVVASGTSSATAQVAGVLAIVLDAVRSKGGTMTQSLAKELLRATARGVSRGSNALGIAATPDQPNDAVGCGIVDVSALLAACKARNLI
jgi:subtilisin family serine protease